MAKKEYKFKFSTPKEMKASLTKIANLLANGKMKHYDARAISRLCETILKVDEVQIKDKEFQEMKQMFEELMEDRQLEY